MTRDYTDANKIIIVKKKEEEKSDQRMDGQEMMQGKERKIVYPEKRGKDEEKQVKGRGREGRREKF